MQNHICIRLQASIVICCICIAPAFAQTDNINYNAQFNRMEPPAFFLPVAFAGGATMGSPWYCPVWVRGQVSFNNGTSLPVAGAVLYMNYNKSTNRVYFKKDDSIVAFYNPDIAGFRLDDSLGIHSFVRLVRISKSDFFEVLVEPGEGLALYKKPISRLRAADYQDFGYINTGSRSPRYVDNPGYYLLKADGKTYGHFFLSQSNIRQRLSRMNAGAKKFLENHPGPIDEVMLISFCERMNAEAASK